MANKKKQLLTATLIIALSAAVAVNWYYTNNPVVSSDENTTAQYQETLGDSLLVAGSAVSGEESENEQSQSNSEDAYFSEAKLNRTQKHDEIVEEIEDFLEDDSISQSDKSEIVNMLTAFKDNMKKETDTENLIKAKIGGECVVTINDDAGSVVVKKGTLNDTVIMQITDIFEKNTGISPENLTIIEAK